MSVELTAVLSMGIALAGLILKFKWDIVMRLESIKRGQVDLRKRMARLEGMLEGYALCHAGSVDPD